MCYLLLADLALNFLRSLISKQWQEAGGWAGSSWAAAVAQRAADGVAAAARVHDSYLLCRDPVVALKTGATLWALAVLGSFLRWVCQRARQRGILQLSGATMMPRRGLASSRQHEGALCHAALLPVDSTRALRAPLMCPSPPLHRPQHLEPGHPCLCCRLHPARRLRPPPWDRQPGVCARCGRR